MAVIGSNVSGGWTTTRLTTGEEFNADSLPTAVLRRNGTTVATVPTVSNKSTGEYFATALINSSDGWQLYDHWEMVATWLMGGKTKKLVLGQGYVSAVPTILDRQIVYPDGYIYIDTVNGSAGAVNFVNGTTRNPVNNLADAITLATNLNLKRFKLLGLSSITFTSTFSGYRIEGEGQSVGLVLNGQSFTNSTFSNINSISGVSASTGLAIYNSLISVSTLNGGRYSECALNNVITLGTAGTYIFDRCFTTSVNTAFDFKTSAENITVFMPAFSGRMEIRNLGQSGSIDTIYIYGDGELTLASSCVGGTINVAGNIKITNNGSGITINQESRYQIDRILSDSTAFKGKDIPKIIPVIESQREHHEAQGEVFFVDPINGNTHASGARGGKADPYNSVQDCHDNAVVDGRRDLILLIASNAAVTTLTEAVTLTKRGLNIRGPGRGFLWTRTGNGNTITVTGNRISLSGFQLDTSNTGNGNGLDVNGADFFRASRLWVNDTRGDGIHAENCTNIVIENCKLQASGQTGSGHGIFLQAGPGEDISYGRLSDNYLIDVQGDGIRIRAIGSGEANGLIIERNVIANCDDYGININDSDVNRTFITDNRFGNNGSGPINDTGTDTVLLNNEQWAKENTLLSIQSNVSDISSRIPDVLVGGNIKSVPQAVNAALDLYHSDIEVTLDDVNGRDEYTITWFKNGVRIATGITSPTIRVIKRVDGTDLISTVAMSQVGTTGSYKYDEIDDRISAGEAVLIIVTATIDGSSRSFARIYTTNNAIAV